MKLRPTPHLIAVLGLCWAVGWIPALEMPERRFYKFRSGRSYREKSLALFTRSSMSVYL